MTATPHRTRTTFDCTWLLAEPGAAPAQRNVRITLADGRIDAITPLPDAVPGRQAGRTGAAARVGRRGCGDGRGGRSWRACRRAVRAERGRVCGVDEPALQAELLARLRAALAADAGHHGWRSTVKALAEDLAPFYRHGHFGGCCG